MPTMADITLKKYDEATNITWAGIQNGSSSERPSIWQSQSVGTAVSHRPEARLIARQTGATERRVRITIQYPSLSTDSTTGITSIITRQKFSGEWTLDLSAPQGDVREFASQGANFIASTLIKSCLAQGLGT